jgi:8-oxo-dGTP pyrophosphatase MutT (NUDIX family)
MDDESSPWRTTASRSLLRDRWIDLRADSLLTRTGQAIEPWYVLDYPEWSVAVALTPDDRLVLVRQWRHAAQRWSLELPGGVVDAADPDPTAAARRELLEETGHGAEEWRYLTAGYPNPAIQTNRLHVSLALGARPMAAAQPEAAEELETVLMPVDEALAALPHGLLGQSMHVGALLLGLQAAGRIAFTRPEETAR